jgi:hypothetical protein
MKTIQDIDKQLSRCSAFLNIDLPWADRNYELEFWNSVNELLDQRIKLM